MTVADQMLAYLRTARNGGTKLEIADAIGCSVFTLHNAARKLSKAKLIESLVVGGAGKDNHTRRYYATGIQRVIESKTAVIRHAKQRTAEPSKGWKDAPATNPNRVKPQVAAPFVDRRFKFDPPPGWVGVITQDWEQERGL